MYVNVHKEDERRMYEEGYGNFGKRSKVKSNQLSMKSRWRTGVKGLTQKLLLLRCLLVGGYLDFGDEPEEENPQGPKLVSRRLSSGCC